MSVLAEDSTTDNTDGTVAEKSALSPPSRLGRLLFGVFLAFMALDSFRNLDQTIDYAETKDVPSAEL